MPNGFTVRSLANLYADRQLAHQNLDAPQQVLARKRIIYDFEVTGFNVMTVAVIASLALAIITSSVTLFILTVLTSNIRRSFMREVLETALIPPEGGLVNADLLRRIANLNPVQRRNEIAAYLEIEDENWEVMQYEIFDFKGWMNWIPGPRPAEAEPALQLPQLPPQAVLARPRAERGAPAAEVLAD